MARGMQNYLFYTKRIIITYDDFSKNKNISEIMNIFKVSEILVDQSSVQFVIINHNI